MNLRQSVLCERLHQRARDQSRPVVPAQEDHLHALEAQLGFTFPEMFRILYRTMSFDLGCLSLSRPMLSLEEAAARKRKYAGQRTPGVELPPPLIGALRRYPGSYVSYGEDGMSENEPEWWVDIAGRDEIVVLEGHSGYLYYEERGEDWSKVSFCAPSIEDWLERELDASPSVVLRYFPTVNLTTILEAEPPQPEVEASVSAATSLEQTMASRDTSDRTLIAGTEQLREENLSDEALDPLERRINERIRLLKASNGIEARLARLQKLGTPRALRESAHLRSMRQLAEQDVTKLREKLAEQLAHDKALQIQRRLWRVGALRHHILRELYTLLEDLESRDHPASPKGSAETAGMQELQPLIEADSALFRFLSLDRRPEEPEKGEQLVPPGGTWPPRGS